MKSVILLIVVGAFFAVYRLATDCCVVRVPPHSIGVVKLLGTPHREMRPGLGFKLPPPLETVELVAVTRQISSPVEVLARRDGASDKVIVSVVYWRPVEATKYLSHKEKAVTYIKEAVESAARDLAVRDGRPPDNNELLREAQARLQARDAGIRLDQISGR